MWSDLRGVEWLIGPNHWTTESTSGGQLWTKNYSSVMQGLGQWRRVAVADSVYMGRIKITNTHYEMKELFVTEQQEQR